MEFFFVLDCQDIPNADTVGSTDDPASARAARGAQYVCRARQKLLTMSTGRARGKKDPVRPNEKREILFCFLPTR